jgi:hypothetical protein
MAIYHLDDKSLTEIPETRFDAEGVRERQDLQAVLRPKIEVIAPDCLVIAEEFSRWSGSQRRIDLLAVDKDANLVVIELKRTETGEHMELQALRYAAMVSPLTFKKAVSIFQEYLDKRGEEKDAETELLNFFKWTEPQEEKFALDVKMVLVSANFSTELTTSVMWLNERNLDIKCVRLNPYRFDGKILVNVEQIIPLPEATDYQVELKEQSDERRQATSKDYTNYVFDGQTYSKRGLVLAVIQEFISENKPKSFSDLLDAFPQETRSGGMFVPVSEAQEILNRGGIARHFLGEDEIVKFPDSTQYAVSNQWGKGNIGGFLDRARQRGYEILPLPNKSRERGDG